jgi:cell division protein FtsB
MPLTSSTSVPGEHDTPPARPLRPRRRFETAQDVQRRRRRLLGYVMIAGSLVVVVSSFFGENGYFATLRAEREHAELQASITRTRLENQRLQQEIRRLDTDPTALEEAARRDLGLIKPGETLIIVKDRVPGQPRRQ